MAVVTLASGATTDTTATVAAEIDEPATPCRLAYSLNESMAAPDFSDEQTSDAEGYVKLPVDGLTANRRYFYAVEIDGELDPTVGQFRTHPTPGQPASFTIAHGSCAAATGQNALWSASVHRVWDSIRERDPLMFFHLGDWHYKNIAVAEDGPYQDGYRALFTAQRQGDVFRNIAVSGIYDDHDFGPNNSNKMSVGRLNASRVYRQVLPHYPVAGAGANYQAWTIGRFRFILTDLRYERSVNGQVDDATKTMMGAEQKAWFKAELLAAKNDPNIVQTVWLNSQVWCVDPPYSALDEDKDHWGGFSTERAEINNFMADNGITDVIQLTGDQHALGIARGIDYSTAQTAPMNVYAGSALDSDGLTRGSAWDAVSEGRGRYGTLTVTDNGAYVVVRWDGWAVDDTTGAETLVMSDTFTVGEPAAATHTYVMRTYDADSGEWVPRYLKTWDGIAWQPRPIL